MADSSSIDGLANILRQNGVNVEFHANDLIKLAENLSEAVSPLGFDLNFLEFTEPLICSLGA